MADIGKWSRPVRGGGNLPRGTYADAANTNKPGNLPSGDGGQDGHLDNPDGTKRFAKRDLTCKLVFVGYSEPMAKSTKRRTMPYGKTVLNGLERHGVDLNAIAGIQEFFQEKFYAIEFKPGRYDAMKMAMSQHYSWEHSPCSNTMCPLGEKDSRVRRRLGGVPTQVSLDQIREALQDAIPTAACQILRLRRMQFPAFVSEKGTQVPPMPSGEVLIDLDVDNEEHIPQAIWLQIGWRYEGFGLLREGRNAKRRNKPDLRFTPAHLVQTEQEDKMAAIWREAEETATIQELAPSPTPLAPSIPIETPLEIEPEAAEITHAMTPSEVIPAVLKRTLEKSPVQKAKSPKKKRTVTPDDKPKAAAKSPFPSVASARVRDLSSSEDELPTCQEMSRKYRSMTDEKDDEDVTFQTEGDVEHYTGVWPPVWYKPDYGGKCAKCNRRWRILQDNWATCGCLNYKPAALEFDTIAEDIV